ncbi:hypothetical protein, partial [Bradyrhizobium algeriense]|uniref:hypothetical protein n=1 Tax=Bradyrhizobium algeriense TaxID=634784 RepID=UPI001AED013F
VRTRARPLVLDDDSHGPPFPVPTNGTVEKHGNAERHVIECDQRMASFYGVCRIGAQCYLPRLTP